MWVEFFNNTNTFICFLNVFIDMCQKINFLCKSRPKRFCKYSLTIGKFKNSFIFFYEKRQLLELAWRYLD